MEESLSDVIEKISNYQQWSKKEILDLKTLLKEKNEEIIEKRKEITKHTEDMKDLLSASFAIKSRNELDRIKTQLSEKESKIDNMRRLNSELQYKIDNIHQEKKETCEKSTQTEDITIQTKKTKYILKNDVLEDEKGKNCGEIVSF